MDPDLEYPDSDGHGSYLTASGSLLNYPWEYDSEFDSCRIFLYRNGQKVNVENVPLTSSEKNLVFELCKNGTLRYWSKNDYIKSPIDTVTQLDGIKSLRKIHDRSDNIALKKQYSLGTWTVDFKDSLIKLSFGNNLIYPGINAKVRDVDPSDLNLILTYLFQKEENGQTIDYRKEKFIHFTH